jgi:hypothetical protein
LRQVCGHSARIEEVQSCATQLTNQCFDLNDGDRWQRLVIK